MFLFCFCCQLQSSSIVLDTDHLSSDKAILIPTYLRGLFNGNFLQKHMFIQDFLFSFPVKFSHFLNAKSWLADSIYGPHWFPAFTQSYTCRNRLSIKSTVVFTRYLLYQMCGHVSVCAYNVLKWMYDWIMCMSMHICMCMCTWCA